MSPFDIDRLRAALNQWFFDSPATSRWVNVGPLQCYMRKTPVSWRRETFSAITIANVSVHRKNQRLGWFREVIEWAKKQDVELLKIENAVTPRMVILCEKNGWLSDGQNPPSYYLPVNIR